jgi:hypothetical protein
MVSLIEAIVSPNSNDIDDDLESSMRIVNDTRFFSFKPEIHSDSATKEMVGRGLQSALSCARHGSKAPKPRASSSPRFAFSHALTRNPAFDLEFVRKSLSV